MAVSLGMVIALIKKFGGGGGGGGGGVTDVKVNGTSVVSGGKANIPLADANNPGVAMVGGSGLVMSNGKIIINPATSTDCKVGSAYSAPVTPYRQHESVFFGLAKSAGDSSQASSSNAVGAYTENAKSAISQMLDAPETISGTTPSITGKAGVRYICGEVSTISITPPASGAVDVVFESGSTPAVLTVPSTVKFPAWFDADDLEANKTYEINILDGVYGVVTSWA